MKSCNFKLKRHSGRNGSTLLLVIILSAVAVLLTTAVTTAVVSANSVSSDTINSKQAYFTARSAANATMQEILNYKKDKLNDSNFYDEINSFVSNKIVGGNLVAAADSSSLTYIGRGCSNLGYYEIKSFYVADEKSAVPVGSVTNYLRIEAVGYYPCSKKNPTKADLAKCSKSKVSLLMVNNQSGSTDPTPPDNPLNATNPFENVLCFTDNSNNETLSVDGASVIGNIVNSGPISIDKGGYNGINAKGRIFSTSDVSISEASLGITSVEAMGDVTLSDNAEIKCDVNAQGDFNSKRCYYYNIIVGNITIDGDANLNDTIVYGNVTSGGKVTLNEYSHVYGNVTCHKTVSNGGEITGTVKEGATVDKVPITYRPLSNYPAYTAPKDVPNTVVNQSNISDGGTLRNESFNGGNLTVDTGTDTKGSSVSLVVDKGLVLNNQSLKLKGTHNLFIYLQNSASIVLKGNSEIGMSNENVGSKIFIIGTTQNVYVLNNSLLRAAVYLPKGGFYANWSNSGLKNFWGFYWDQNYNYNENDLNNDKFIGSIVTKNMEVYTGGYNILFYKPDLTDTPFYNDFIVGDGGAGNNGNGYAYGKNKGNSGNGNTEHKNTVDSWGFDSWVK